MDTKEITVSWLWWLKLLLMGGVSLLLLLLGINTLLSAYLLKNPLEFIMLFFSSSFMILLHHRADISRLSNTCGL